MRSLRFRTQRPDLEHLERCRRQLNATASALQSCQALAEQHPIATEWCDILLLHHFLIPVFCSDTDTIQHGVLAAFGPNQYNIGTQTGKMVKSILLDQKRPGEIPVQFPNSNELKINLVTANSLNIKINDNLVKMSSEVIE